MTKRQTSKQIYKVNSRITYLDGAYKASNQWSKHNEANRRNANARLGITLGLATTNQNHDVQPLHDDPPNPTYIYAVPFRVT